MGKDSLKVGLRAFFRTSPVQIFFPRGVVVTYLQIGVYLSE
jgi:hypothetical protein